MTRMIGAIALSMILAQAGCSAAQNRKEQPLPQCLSLCGNQFASCTDKNAGDFGSCKDQRDECRQTCEGDHAERRMENQQQNQQIVAPIDTSTNNNAPAPAAQTGTATQTNGTATTDGGSTPTAQ